MNKSKLLELGLDEDQAAKVETALKGYVSKERFDEVNELGKSRKTELDKLQKQIDSLEGEKKNLETALNEKDGEGKALADMQAQLSAKEAQIQTLQETHSADMESLRLDQAVALQLTDAQDVELVLSQLDRTQLKRGEGGEIDGLNDQLNQLRAKKPFLFKAKEEASKPKTTGFTPFGGSGAGPQSADGNYTERLQQAKNMAERIQIKQEAHEAGVNLN